MLCIYELRKIKYASTDSRQKYTIDVDDQMNILA